MMGLDLTDEVHIINVFARPRLRRIIRCNLKPAEPFRAVKPVSTFSILILFRLGLHNAGD